jgi:hypothetical protein
LDSPDEWIAKESNAISQEGENDDVDGPNFTYDNIGDVEKRNANDASKSDGHS